MPDEKCSACGTELCACKSEVQLTLEKLDGLLSASEPLSKKDLDAVETWADNVYLDTMRHRRLRAARRGGSDA
jgi:hypothetical protein